MSDTPETDAAVRESNGQWSNVLKETCGRLERERNVALEQWELCIGLAKKNERERDKAREDATNYYARIGELESERNELKEIVEQRILVGLEIHNKANSLIKQNDKTEAECERLRKQLNAATSALRQIHLEVGDWIRSTVIVNE